PRDSGPAAGSPVEPAIESASPEPFGTKVASSIIRIVTFPGCAGTPPELTTVWPAVRTATIRVQAAFGATVAVTVGEPNSSRGAVVLPSLRTTTPSPPIVLLPFVGNASVLVGGSAAYETALPLHGSGASSIGGHLSIPFGEPFRKRSNHSRASVIA